MTQRVDITDINTIVSVSDSPIYVLVAGGIGAGKSTVVQQHVNMPIMDIDDVMDELGYKEYTHAQTAEAMEIITKRVEDVLDKKESMVAMGTSANLSFSIDRLYGAKQRGYKTVLLWVDTPVDLAIKQNCIRREANRRAVRLEEEYKIERTSIAAANTVASLKRTMLVDYYVHYVKTFDEQPVSQPVKQVDIWHLWTDGSCHPNPGKGGYGWISYRDGTTEDDFKNGNGEFFLDSGSKRNTTNNQMELLAVIKGLEFVKRKSSNVVVYSDSQYVINTMTKGWARKKNVEMWNQLDHVVKGMNVTWQWVRGHNNTLFNEAVDSLANSAVNEEQ